MLRGCGGSDRLGCFAVFCGVQLTPDFKKSDDVGVANTESHDGGETGMSRSDEFSNTVEVDIRSLTEQDGDTRRLSFVVVDAERSFGFFLTSLLFVVAAMFSLAALKPGAACLKTSRTGSVTGTTSHDRSMLLALDELKLVEMYPVLLTGAASGDVVLDVVVPGGLVVDSAGRAGRARSISDRTEVSRRRRSGGCTTVAASERAACSASVVTR